MATKELKKDIEDLKIAVNMMSQFIASMNKNMSTMMHLMKEIGKIKKTNEEQENRINSSENHLLDWEQYSRINDVIVTGLKIKPISYSKAEEGEDQQDKDRHEESTEAQVTAFLQEKTISIDRDDIEACHTILIGNKTGRGANHVIITRFTNRKKNIHLLKQGRKLKGTDVCLNEHLIKRNADIAKKSKILEEMGKVAVYMDPQLLSN